MDKSEVARIFCVNVSSVKHYTRMAEGGCSLAPKIGPGSKPKLDERSSKLLEADLSLRPAQDGVEPVFGQVKDVRGFRRFSFRGLPRCRRSGS